MSERASTRALRWGALTPETFAAAFRRGGASFSIDHPQGRCSVWLLASRAVWPQQAKAYRPLGWQGALVNDLGPEVEVGRWAPQRTSLPVLPGDGSTGGR